MGKGNKRLRVRGKEVERSYLGKKKRCHFRLGHLSGCQKADRNFDQGARNWRFGGAKFGGKFKAIMKKHKSGK